MKGDPSIALGLPRPGRGLKAVLIAVFALGILNALFLTWAPPAFNVVFQPLLCEFARVRHWELWRLVTSGLLTDPEHYGHLFFTLVGLYFLAPDLERRWGTGRLLLFLGSSVVAGNLAVMTVDWLAPASAQPRFHPPFAFGASAAIAAIAVAWARDNANNVVRLFFVLPMRGRWLLWATIGFCVLDLIFPTALPEGVIAPFGGVAAGLLFAGSPSLVRTVYLHLKLMILRRRAGSLSVSDVLAPRGPRRPRPGAPPLRVVSGGVEDALRKREPPKDKRYLN
jgi:membrane associated rhomboid family serine protease